MGSKSLEQKELPIELVRRDRLELIKEPVTIRTPEVSEILRSTINTCSRQQTRHIFYYHLWHL